jgi:hypothetical protein
MALSCARAIAEYSFCATIDFFSVLDAVFHALHAATRISYARSCGAQAIVHAMQML